MKRPDVTLVVGTDWPDRVHAYVAQDVNDTIELWCRWEQILGDPSRRWSGGMPTPGKEHL